MTHPLINTLTICRETITTKTPGEETIDMLNPRTVAGTFTAYKHHCARESLSPTHPRENNNILCTAPMRRDIFYPEYSPNTPINTLAEHIDRNFVRLQAKSDDMRAIDMCNNCHARIQCLLYTMYTEAGQVSDNPTNTTISNQVHGNAGGMSQNMRRRAHHTALEYTTRKTQPTLGEHIEAYTQLLAPKLDLPSTIGSSVARHYINTHPTLVLTAPPTQRVLKPILRELSSMLRKLAQTHSFHHTKENKKKKTPTTPNQ